MAPKGRPRGRPSSKAKATNTASSPDQTQITGGSAGNSRDGQPAGTEAVDGEAIESTFQGDPADIQSSAAPPTDTREDVATTQVQDQDSQSQPPPGFTPVNKFQSTKKYQPKAVVRRTQEERQAYEREQNLQQTARRNAAESSRGPRGRRGGADRQGHRNRPYESRTSQASGIFGGDAVKEKATRPTKSRSSVAVYEDPEPTPAAQEASAGSSASQTKASTRVKKEDLNKVAADKDDDGDVIIESSKPKRRTTGGRGTKTKIKTEDPQAGYVSDEARWADDVGPKVEIAKISLLSDEEDGSEEDAARKHYAATSYLRPVRLEREEHQEPDFGINTEASSLAAAEIRRQKLDRSSSNTVDGLAPDQTARIIDSVSKVKRKPRDVDFVRVERRWKGVYEDDEDAADRPVKEEPREDDAMDLDGVAPHEAPTSVERPRVGNEDDEAPGEEGADSAGRRKRSPGYFHDLPADEPVLLDEEDPDLAKMARLVQEFDQEEEIAAGHRRLTSDRDPFIHDSSHLKGDPSREGKIFLLQLPPILPKLGEYSKVTAESKSKDPDAIMSDANPDPSSTAAKSPSKSDPDAKFVAPPHVLHADSVASIQPPNGCPGTITFYKSGKIMANWGGLELEVNQQHQAGFAQEVLVHDWQRTTTKVEGTGQWEEVIRVGEEAHAVGEVEGGFIAGPDLESLLGR